MNGLFADCRHAVRLYLRTPAASLIAILVLAVGMAFVAAFLSLYVDLVLRPEPGFEQGGQIATAGQNGGPRMFGLPIEVVDQMDGEMASIEAVAIAFGLNVLLGPEREESMASLVSAEFFSGLRPRLALGRGIRPDENRPDAEPVAVISYRLWQERYQGSPAVLDEVLELTRDPRVPYLAPADRVTGAAAPPVVPEQETTRFRIVGVLARPLPTAMGANADAVIALERTVTLYYGPYERRRLLNAPTFVRKRPGVSAAAVADELTARYSDYPFLASNYYPGVRLDTIDGIVDDITVKRETERQLQIFLAGSMLLALVAAANVSLFLLARAPGRRRELGIRMAVGTPFGRIARQLATEAGLLVIVAALIGLAISHWLSIWLRTQPIFSAAQWRDVALLDWRVLGLTGVFIILLTLLVSLTPLPGIRRLGIGAASRQTTARASPMQRATGTGQIAVAGALGGAAIAFAWYLGTLLFGYAGYEVTNRYLLRFNNADMSADSSLADYFVELSRRREIIGAIPGIDAFGFGTPVPGADPSIISLVSIARPDDPTRIVAASTGMLDTGYMDALGLELVRGRAPARGDGFESGGPVVLVNQAFARAVWDREDVVGERLDNRAPAGWRNAEIIGVLADLSFEHPSAAAVPYVFLGANQYMGRMAVIETRMSAAGLHTALDELVSTGALEQPIRDIRPLQQLRMERIATDRARAFLAITAATLVVLLTAFGYYGTQRYLVAAGRREYAIRASLGAGPAALGRLVIARALLMSVPGLACGGLLAFIAVAWLREEYLGGRISPARVTVLVVMALCVLLIASSLGPARAARRTQPARLLRED